jgi:hypothetical protein
VPGTPPARRSGARCGIVGAVRDLQLLLVGAVDVRHDDLPAGLLLLLLGGGRPVEGQTAGGRILADVLAELVDQLGSAASDSEAFVASGRYPPELAQIDLATVVVGQLVAMASAM